MSHKSGDRRSQLKRDPVLLDVIDVLRAVVANVAAPRFTEFEIAAIQRLQRHAAMQRLRGMQTPHSDPENGVAQEDAQATQLLDSEEVR